jgi:glycosyltransferase involved in cell wall biosynthesis
MSKKKVSLITTERNEAGAIKEFLESALNQSRKPDEIVIADAASNDDTVDIINEYAKQYPQIRLVNAPGNRSVGRNAAIEAAQNEVIAVTDVGCRLDPDWLKNITNPFETAGVEVVSGMFKPEPKTSFERISTDLMLQSNQKIDVATWLPSSRSIAFTKTAWEKAGRYPEYEEFGNATVARLCGGEDTLYDLNLRKAGYTFHDGLAGVVYWRPRPNLVEFFRQYKMYSTGDGIRMVDHKHFTRLTIRWLLTAAVLVASLAILPLLAVLPLAITAYNVGRRIMQPWRQSQSGVTGLVTMAVLIMVYDWAQIIGYWIGVYHRTKLPADKRITF